jgi:hypothetical protein
MFSKLAFICILFIPYYVRLYIYIYIYIYKMLSWHPNSTLHCMPPMQPTQLIKFSNFESKPQQRHKRLNSNYFTRRTSGQCLGTFKIQNFPFCDPFLAVPFTSPPPLKLYFYLSLSLSLERVSRIYTCLSKHLIIVKFRAPLWSSGHSSWLQIQRSGFDSRRYQIF